MRLQTPTHTSIQNESHILFFLFKVLRLFFRVVLYSQQNLSRNYSKFVFNNHFNNHLYLEWLTQIFKTLILFHLRKDFFFLSLNHSSLSLSGCHLKLHPHRILFLKETTGDLASWSEETHPVWGPQAVLSGVGVCSRSGFALPAAGPQFAPPELLPARDP